MNRPKYHDELPAYLRWLAGDLESGAMERRNNWVEVSRLGGKAQGLRLAAEVVETTVARPSAGGEP